MTTEVPVALGSAVFLATIIPVLICFFIFPLVGTPNAAAIAVTYGSTSAVTFGTGP